MDISYISCHTLQEDAGCLFVSPSVKEALGYEPEELVGRRPADLIHPDQLPTLRKVWRAVVLSELVGFLIYIHVKRKSGDYVLVSIVTSICGELNFSITSIVDPESECTIARESTAEECVHVSLDGELRYLNWNFRSARLQEIMNIPSEDVPPPILAERRVAMILNRYTLSLAILYVSSSEVIGLDPETAIGISFLDQIYPSQRHRVEVQLGSVKTCNSVTRLRFGWVRTHPTTLSEGRKDFGSEDGEAMEYHSGASAEDQPGQPLSSSPSFRSSPEFPPRGSDAESGMYTEGESESSGTNDSRSSLDTQTGAGDVIPCEAVIWGSSDGLVCVLRRAENMNWVDSTTRVVQR